MARLNRYSGLILAFFLFYPLTVFSVDYYVDVNEGDLANDGLSWANPKASIQSAVALATAVGDRVLVAQGTYNEQVTFPAHDNFQLLGGYPSGGGIQNPSSNPTIIDGTGLNGSLVTIPGDFSTFNQHSYQDLVIDGFTLQNALMTTGSDSALKSESADLKIKRCIVQNNSNVAAFGTAGGIRVLSLINDNFNTKLQIEETIVRNNSATGVGGIFIDPIGIPTVEMTNCLIEGNHASSTSPITASAGGVVIGAGLQTVASVTVTNCTVTNNTGSRTSNPVGGFYLGIDNFFNYTVRFKNSILWNAQEDIFQEPQTFVTAQATYSIVRDTNDSPFTYGTGVIHSDPSFVGGGDYTLMANSPAINSGTASGAPVIDLLGTARPFGGGYDMGAYEYDIPDSPPIVSNPIANQNVDEDAADSQIDLSNVFTDPEDNTITLVVQGNTNTGLVMTNLVGTTLTVDYLDDQNGNADITIRATANGLSVDDTFNVSVTAVDDPPVLDSPIADLSVDEDAEDTVIDLSTVFIDVDGALEFNIEGNTNSALLENEIAGNELTLSYSENANGSADITVRAMSDGAIIEDTFQVTVDPVDDPPIVANPIADISVDEDASAMNIDLSTVFEDIDSSLITINIQSNTNTNIVMPELQGNIVTLSFLPDQFGSADITLRATADTLSIDETFNLKLNPVNDPPIFTSSNTLAFQDGVSEVGELTASDIEDDAVTFSLIGGDDELLFSLSIDGQLSFISQPDINTPRDANGDNNYELIVEAFDGEDFTQQALTVSDPSPECSYFIIKTQSTNLAVVCL